MKAGDRFKSYDELQSAIHAYELQNFVLLWKRDSRTIANARTRKKIKPCLKYEELKYTCIHGGKNFHSKGMGSREIRSYKQKCPMMMRFRVSRNGKSLEVKQIIETHNHEVNETWFKNYYPKRKLRSETETEILDKFKNKCQKEKIHLKKSKKTGKVISFKDLKNTKAKLRKREKNLKRLTANILEKHGGTVSLYRDEKGNFKGLFIQNENMKSIVSAYPEFLACDATHKKNNVDLPLYIMLTEDGICQSHIVGIGLLVYEDKYSLSWLFRTFKQENPITASRLKWIITDKHMTERNVIREIYPHISLISCIFYVLRTFRRDIVKEKLGIKNVEIALSLDYIEQLAGARTDAVFKILEDEFRESVPKSVIAYYDENWKNCRDEWNVNENFIKCNFMSNTIKRLEKTNGVIQTAGDKDSDLETFIDNLFETIYLLNNKKEHSAIHSMQKPLYNKFPEESDEYKFHNLLTAQSAKLVLNEIECSQKETITCMDDGSNYFSKNSYATVRVTTEKCTCQFYVAMLLPCRHIFALRKKLQLPLYSETLILERWRKNYYLKSHIAFKAYREKETDRVESTKSISSVPLSFADKRKQLLSKTNALAELGALRSNDLFQLREQALETLINMWKNGIEVKISPLEVVTTEIKLEDFPMLPTSTNKS
ncbi:uncharacterized protein LOC117178001 [Belonocnema kinseyi]|uniref:uncharacterized protein LOC117178001 n=1 Tax=Belonocnema kinseyi TaxID=2817044 RepID=UPI00143CC803|nr:uncharacterized protein LOC117178001 [Belonocnema kinseyi]